MASSVPAADALIGYLTARDISWATLLAGRRLSKDPRFSLVLWPWLARALVTQVSLLEISKAVARGRAIGAGHSGVLTWKGRKAPVCPGGGSRLGYLFLVGGALPWALICLVLVHWPLYFTACVVLLLGSRLAVSAGRRGATKTLSESAEVRGLPRARRPFMKRTPQISMLVTAGRGPGEGRLLVGHLSRIHPGVRFYFATSSPAAYDTFRKWGAQPEERTWSPVPTVWMSGTSGD